MGERTTIHREVSDFYTKVAVTPSAGCCAGPAQKGVAAQVAGYSADELEALPADAVENSFGCGNPVAFAGVGEGETVVDLGSGAGIDLLLAAKKVGPAGRVIGVDMTDEMNARARRNAAAAGLENVAVRKGVIEDLPVRSASADWVFSNCVINLSPDKPKVFAEIARVLKPGGRMLVSDIVVEELPEWVRRNKALYAVCIAGAVSERDYVEGLGKAGLEDIEVVDRLVYEASQIEGLIRSELPGVEAGMLERGGNLAEIAKELEGKVWSAKFSARKPA